MTAQRGFTLIEILIAVFIIVLVTASAALAFRNTDSRALSSESDALVVWLENIQDRAVLDGNLYGVYIEDGQLFPLTYVGLRWYRTSSFTPWSSERFQLSSPLEDEVEQDTLEFLADEDEWLEPLAVFLPDSSALPAGTFELQSDAGDVSRILWSAQGEFSVSSGVDG